MPALQGDPLRFCGPLPGQWARAWHKVQVSEVQCHCAEGGITGAVGPPHVVPATPEQVSPFGMSAQPRSEYSAISAGRPVRGV